MPGSIIIQYKSRLQQPPYGFCLWQRVLTKPLWRLAVTETVSLQLIHQIARH